MEVKIVEQKENPLLNRKEVSFMISHASSPTPKQEAVRAKIAALTTSDEKLIIIEGLKTTAGTNTSKGFAKIYKTPEDMQVIESRKIANKQHKPVEAPKKEEKLAEKPAEEKPKEKAKPAKEEKKEE